MYDVVIIGAGVVGGMIARVLSRYELNVCLIDKENDVACGATKANSAIIHAGFDAKEGSLKAKLNVQGSEMMEKIAEDLGVKYQRNGSLVIGFCDEDKDIIENLYQRGIQNGVKELAILNQDELRALEPNISDNAVFALYAPTGAITCPYELTIAAVGNAMDNGVHLKLNFEVVKIKTIANGFEIASESETIQTKYIINAAGLFADKIAKMVGDDSFTIHPRKGEYILLDKECGNIVSHTIFQTPTKAGKGILVTPTVDGNLLIGPTSVDMEDKTDVSVSRYRLTQVMSGAGKSVKNIHYGKSITSFCGHRAAGSTGDFIIGSNIQNVINVAGIESPGLSASPAIAEYVKNLLIEQGLTLTEKKNYNPKRRSMTYFRDASEKEKNEIIKQNPAFGRILCRCELVTEGEILEAISTNPKPTDLDGIKRRTRAQMGRCQGGFCAPYIIDLLAKEQNIPFEQVTKFGKNSYLNAGKTKEDVK